MFSLSVGLERQKAKMTLQMTRTSYTPGEVVCGVVNINVQQNMKITAVRLDIRAKEQCDFKVKGSGRVQEEFIHFQQEITFFGFSKLSGRKGGAELGAGSYQYPFQVPIPATAPPSYYFKGSSGTSSLDWKVKATIVIPNSPFDAKEEVPLTVYSAITKKQLDELTASPYAAGSGRSAIPASSKCCGSGPGDLDVAVTTFPRAILMQRGRTTTSETANNVNAAGAVQAPFQAYPSEEGYAKKQPELVFEEPPSYQVEQPVTEQEVPNVLTVPADSGFSDNDNAITIRLKIAASKADASIKKVRVTLHQFAQVTANGHSFCDLQRLTGINIVPPAKVIKKGSTLSLDAHLALGDLVRIDQATPITAPLPSVATKMFESSFIVTVSFPDSNIKDEMTVNNVGYIFSVLDMAGKVPLAPTRYVTADVKQEQILSGV